MENINKVGDDEKKNKIIMLKKQLELEMQSVNDDMGVERIRKIIDELDKLEPIQLSSSPEERFKNFQYHFAKAVEDREEFRKITQRTEIESHKEKEQKRFFYKIPKVGFTILVTVAVFCFSSAVVISAFGLLNPLIEWADTTFNRSHIDNKSDSNSDSDSDSDITYSNYNDIESHFGIPIFKPIYLIEKCELESFDYVDNASQTDFYINYNNDDTIISYDIIIYKQNDFVFEHKIERNQVDGETYTYNNTPVD